ncbi:phage replisome organizer N-terminal domain-containing protein [Crassaminicella profunda]|uniref:phage replisome organizer N-terminal domain-containing protein n=1 Tax=Crassaminicella profunda TaxID=1286698 RepID=UPI001CA72EB4|nr:phage replisome organizer N-terminal domain-containing protein [Crassaminicella profunda]QZY55957.1 phage replisome organizer N-terminal domain-containing protein [Crassaminicella profunda]
MADHKKYYYLKLKENFFDSKEIKVLESMENGYKYSNLLLKLYLQSLKYEGELKFNEFIPYNEEMIAAVTRMDIDTVRVALRIFKQLKLIEVLDDGTIFMLAIQDFIGKSSTEAERKKRYRKKIAQEKNKRLTGQIMDKCPNHFETEKDKDGTFLDERPPEIEIDLEKDLEIEKEKGAPPVPYEKIKKLFNENCIHLAKVRSLSQNRKKHLQARWKQFDYNLETFKEIFKKVNESEFCNGSNNRKWKVDFDWLIKNDENMVKVLEGKYDSKPGWRDENAKDQNNHEQNDPYAGIGIEL